MSPRSAEELLADARRRIHRVQPAELAGVVERGGLVVDIRPDPQRHNEGPLPMAVVVGRNVLEWRFDLMGDVTLAEVTGYGQEVVVVCSEGYASSLAAASLREMGFVRAADLDGGFQAWRAWVASSGTALAIEL